MMIPMWMQQILLSFVLRQLKKYGESIDLELVAKDFFDRIEKLIPDGLISPSEKQDIGNIMGIIRGIAEMPAELNNIRLHLESGDVELAASSLMYVVTEKIWHKD